MFMRIMVNCGKQYILQNKYRDAVVWKNAEIISKQKLATSVYPMGGLRKSCCLVFPSYRWDANQTHGQLDLRRRAQVTLYLTSLDFQVMNQSCFLVFLCLLIIFGNSLFFIHNYFKSYLLVVKLYKICSNSEKNGNEKSKILFLGPLLKLSKLSMKGLCI